MNVNNSLNFFKVRIATGLQLLTMVVVGTMPACFYYYIN